MPYQTPDASSYTTMRRLAVQSGVSNTIDSIKLKSPLVYRSYDPSYKLNIVRGGLKSNKGYPSYDEVEEYLKIRLTIDTIEEIPSADTLILPSREPYEPPPAAAYVRSMFTDLAVAFSKRLMAASINSTKLTSGPSLRNIKLSIQTYRLPAERLATVYDVTYDAELSTSQNYAIYKNTNTNTVIIAFKGTSTLSELLIVDSSIAAGYTSNQVFADARDLYSSILNNPAFAGWAIEATGHSLGGTLALYLNFLYGIKAEAFNPGIGKGLFYDNPNKQNATGHVVKGDVVSPLILNNRVVNTLKVYEVENATYGFFGYHIPRNFYEQGV